MNDKLFRRARTIKGNISASRFAISVALLISLLLVLYLTMLLISINIGGLCPTIKDDSHYLVSRNDFSSSSRQQKQALQPEQQESPAQQQQRQQEQQPQPSVQQQGNDSARSSFLMGGIHACVRFSTKFEARDIIPWLHYHARIGISHFHLYFDSSTSNLTNPIEGKAYEMIEMLHYVTIYNMQGTGIDTRDKVFEHCYQSSHIVLKGEWVIEFDIDEVFAFNELVGSEPTCEQGKYGVAAGALADYVSRIPKNVLGVLIPRINFGTNGLVEPNQLQNQIETYVQRKYKMIEPGKALVRTTTGSERWIKLDSMHSIWSSVPNSVIHPFGQPAYIMECDNDGIYCNYIYNASQYPQEMHLSSSAPFMYHYVTRSLSECQSKLQYLPRDNWRVITMNETCRHYSPQEAVYDYSLYCSGKAVTHELHKLFPSYSQPPYIF